MAAEIDKEAAEIADYIARAYHDVGGYRSMPKDALLGVAKEKSDEAVTRLNQKNGTAEAPKEVSIASRTRTRDIIVGTPIVLGFVRDAIYLTNGPEATALGALWLISTLIIAHEMPSQMRDRLLSIPGHLWNSAKSIPAYFSRKIRSKQELRRLRVKIIEALQERDIPIDASKELCESLLAAEAEPEIQLRKMRR